MSAASLAPVTVGFVPLLDVALLVAAREEGFAEEEGVDLKLVREGSWAAVRDKLNAGLLDAAHMLAPAAIASTLGVGHLKVPLRVLSGLNLDGNAITAAPWLAEAISQGLDDPAAATPADTARSLAAALAARRARGEPAVTIGVVFGFSCQLYLMRAWLKSGGLDPEQAARFVVIPPPLMVESLRQKQIDLFCAGAPWNRLAESAREGLVLHPGASIIPDCPEKWLVMRADRVERGWAGGLARAVARASDWASDPANAPALARHLARPDYVGAPLPILEALLSGPSTSLYGRPARWVRLDRGVLRVGEAEIAAVLGLMRDAGHVPASADADELAAMMTEPNSLAAGMPPL